MSGWLFARAHTFSLSGHSPRPLIQPRFRHSLLCVCLSLQCPLAIMFAILILIQHPILRTSKGAYCVSVYSDVQSCGRLHMAPTHSLSCIKVDTMHSASHESSSFDVVGVFLTTMGRK